jgi:AcrR family transcriptional regulator
MNKASDTASRIIEVATDFFARQGYHGTSMRDVAQAAGISIATLYYYAQNKDDLYRQVFQRQYREESELIGGILQEADENVVRDPLALRRLLYRLMDALIDRSARNPDIVRLWTLRWLEKPEKTEDIEAEYSVPLYRMVEHLLSQAQAAGLIRPCLPDLSLVSYSFTWLHYGYFGFGRLTFQAQGNYPLHPDQVEQFRLYLHEFADRMLRFADLI